MTVYGCGKGWSQCDPKIRNWLLKGREMLNVKGVEKDEKLCGRVRQWSVLHEVGDEVIDYEKRGSWSYKDMPREEWHRFEIITLENAIL